MDSVAKVLTAEFLKLCPSFSKSGIKGPFIPSILHKRLHKYRILNQGQVGGEHISPCVLIETLFPSFLGFLLVIPLPQHVLKVGGVEDIGILGPASFEVGVDKV